MSVEALEHDVALLNSFEYMDDEQIKNLNGAIEAITRAHALRPKGKWIRITQGAIPEQYMCPFCHRVVETYGVEELLKMRYPYCHCGADMREE